MSVLIVKARCRTRGPNLKIGVRGANYVPNYNKNADVRTIENGSSVEATQRSEVSVSNPISF